MRRRLVPAGRSGQIFGGQQPGQGDVGAVDTTKVEEKVRTCLDSTLQCARDVNSRSTIYLNFQEIRPPISVRECQQAQQASSIVDKVKSALPFQTLPVLDLAVAPDDKNLGPNEVDKSTLAKLPGADNKFDTAAPGDLHTPLVIAAPAASDANYTPFMLTVWACESIHV
jgi:hypothetical protein